MTMRMFWNIQMCYMSQIKNKTFDLQWAIGVKWVTTRLRALNAALNTFMLLFAAEIILAFVNAKNFYGNENINNC